MIYDCFTFFNEIDILQMRLEELGPVVDKFIIIEMNRTFQGQPKGSTIYQNRGKFGKYEGKMRTFLEECPPEITNPWEREYWQRNRIRTRVSNERPKEDDIILVSDADEIPRRSVVEALDPQPVQSIALDAYYYGLNVSGGHCHTSRAARWSYAQTITTQELRTLDPPPNIVYDGGWHFSYLGDADHIAEKFRSFAHFELNRPDTTNPEILRQRMEAHADLWGDGHHYEVLEIDDTWPEAVKNNREYWSKYEWQKTLD
jgi:beta-1,4-mannosyl-glycoprotein beta-1,4-N-acetylglucosaminyltransferase